MTIWLTEAELQAMLDGKTVVIDDPFRSTELERIDELRIKKTGRRIE